MPESGSLHSAPAPEVLRQCGVERHRPLLIESSKANTHWKLEGRGGEFVLRRYRQRQTSASIEYEFAVLRHLRHRGWPVAAPVRGIVWHEDRAFALFPFLPGRARDHENPAQGRERGRLLARMHADLRELELGQREGWSRLDEVVRRTDASQRQVQVPSSHAAAFYALISSHSARVRDRLDATGIAGFPRSIVHGDFIAQNLLFDGETLTGLLDFDSVHFDVSAADVACARRRAGDEVVHGYLEVDPLEPAERQCLDDLWRASVLRYAFRLSGSAEDRSTVEQERQWCVRQLEETVAFAR
jgi:Ser/Thr protein kinase RdoA (MazF antagonist)